MSGKRHNADDGNEPEDGEGVKGRQRNFHTLDSDEEDEEEKGTKYELTDEDLHEELAQVRRVVYCCLIHLFLISSLLHSTKCIADDR